MNREDFTILRNSNVVYFDNGATTLKPDIVRDKIVELVGDLPRIELFARQKANGWDSWGNEIKSDINQNEIENGGVAV